MRFFIIFVLFFSLCFQDSMHSQTAAMPSAMPAHSMLDVAMIKASLATDEPEKFQREIIQQISEHLYEDTDLHSLAKDLTESLTINELKKLYHVLIRAIDDPWTEELAEHIWQGYLFKMKSEAPVLYNYPRVYLIAVIPGERQFSILLSDGSAWEVAEHLSGEARLDIPTIQSLLGQYITIEEFHGYEGYDYRLTSLGFPEIEFNSYLLANKSSSLILEGKSLFWLNER